MRRFDDGKRVIKNHQWIVGVRTCRSRRTKRCDRDRFNSHWALSRAEFSRN